MGYRPTAKIATPFALIRTVRRQSHCTSSVPAFCQLSTTALHEYRSTAALKQPQGQARQSSTLHTVTSFCVKKINKAVKHTEKKTPLTNDDSNKTDKLHGVSVSK